MRQRSFSINRSLPTCIVFIASSLNHPRPGRSISGAGVVFIPVALLPITSPRDTQIIHQFAIDKSDTQHAHRPPGEACNTIPAPLSDTINGFSLNSALVGACLHSCSQCLIDSRKQTTTTSHPRLPIPPRASDGRTG